MKSKNGMTLQKVTCTSSCQHQFALVSIRNYYKLRDIINVNFFTLPTTIFFVPSFKLSSS